ncbi:MAG: PEGA domain-containing protein [Minicystis sp.]
MKAWEQQKWEQCRAALLAAWGIKKHPQVAGNLAACEAKLGLYRDAAEHVSYFLRELKAESPPERRALGEAVLKEARTKIATVTVKVDAAGAEVLVDGKSVGQAPLEGAVFLEPGHHTIEARRDLDPSVRKAVELVAGGTEEVSLQVTPAAVVVEKVGKGERVAMPPEEQKRSLVPGLVLGGAAGAALISGIALLVDAGAKGSSATELRDQILKDAHSCVASAPNYDTRCTEVAGLSSSGDTRNRVGIGLLAGAGAAAVGAAVYVLWPAGSRGSPSHQRLRIVPAVSAKDAGLLFSGTF